ncbi:unnamed protein product [Didymodactylos carnosus]|uniref:Uncharacterized protein n=1 Tax=Didymodactylos carnosus TaxID=1234261 RepID=A0A814WZ98_9BILA|nr:unnamed protein product [Didymodactylos carnosus]CAF1208784.1 unnamed protein product [Didymodactylos carnosus]CAF3777635.1 unnamed protein product [Didymodactylos carnosus]CAF3972942.1 unnamed protein product [Didymodactylos carnosus]
MLADTPRRRRSDKTPKNIGFREKLAECHTDRSFTESFVLDVSSVSQYPAEEEVLLPAQINFIVDKVDYDENTKKYTIYLAI